MQITNRPIVFWFQSCTGCNFHPYFRWRLGAWTRGCWWPPMEIGDKGITHSAIWRFVPPLELHWIYFHPELRSVYIILYICIYIMIYVYMLYSGIYLKLNFSGVITKSTSHYTIILHEHVPVVCMTKVSTALLRVAFLAGFLRVFWKFKAAKALKFDKNTRDIRNPNQTPTSHEKMMIPKWKSSSFFSKVILLLVCQGTGTCCHGGLGDGVGSDVENPQGLLGISWNGPKGWYLQVPDKGCINHTIWPCFTYIAPGHLRRVFSLGVGSLLVRRYVAVCWKWRNHLSPTDTALRCLL